ncbi:MAG: hypothetical protein IMZ61_13000 [Planctomycetes bacterium]|nr:hypothetical protein [Planctomycetota bacterium]
MKKHLALKACVLLVVMFFHSFVLVPKAHATGWQGIAGRIAFRGVAPSVIALLGSGTALVIGAVVAGGIGYLVYKSGAVTALKNWLTPQLSGTAPDPATIAVGGYVYFYIYSGGEIQCRVHKYSDSSWAMQGFVSGNWTNETFRSSMSAAIQAAHDAWESAGHSPHNFSPGTAAPTVPTDYVVPLAVTQPSFPSDSVFGSPGVAAALAGGAAIVSAVPMSDSDADKFVAGLGGSAGAVIDANGVQAGNPPTTDNTVTAGDTATLGILHQIWFAVSNILGLKTAVEGQKAVLDNTLIVAQSQALKLDNVVAISQSQAGKLDNIVSVGIQQKAALDNIVSMTQAQTTAIESIETKVEHLDNTIANSTSTASTVATRIEALKTAASTKFPFSLASSLSVATVSGTASYEFGSLPLTPSISISIAPMAGPLHALFDWIRQLLVWFFWAGTLLVILRKGMEM